ncbi:MAG: VCBS repeat-containing protein [Bacteroidetes bacterium]|nr:VCBS repeat-containing protein [Bacteroidota bacterium]
MKRLLLLLIPMWLFVFFPSLVNAQSGQGLKMDQSNQSGSFQTPITSPYNLTMEAWIKPLSLSGTQNLFYVGNGSYSGCGIYLVENEITFLAGGVISNGSGVFIEPDKWVHLAFVKDGDNGAFLYVNGSYAASIYNFYPNYISSDQLVSAGGFVGWVDNFRFWTTARAGGQILLDMDREYPLESFSLTRNFLFEESPGTAGFDEVLQTNSFILNNGAIQDVPEFISTSKADGVTSTSVRLNGTVVAKADPTSAKILFSASLFEYTDSINVVQNPLTGGSYNQVYADVTNLNPDTWYYYKTTAVGDSGYFSGKQRSFLTLAPEPTEPAMNFTASTVTSTSATLSWQQGNGERNLVIISEGDFQELPVNGKLYSANSDYSKCPVFGESSRIVYNGVDNTVNVTGLSETTTYFFWVYSFNSGSLNNPSYLTPEISPSEFLTQQSSISSTLIETLSWDQSKVQFADIDNDGRMDFAVMDQTLKLYWNNGEGGYNLWWESNFDCYGEGSINWFYPEYSSMPSLAFFSANSSGILEMGEGWYARLTEDWPIADNFISAMIDYNRDGLMDILVSRDNYPVIQIFKNTGYGTYLILDTTIPFLIFGNFAVSDFNQDGYPDVAYSGSQNDSNSRRAGILWNSSGSGFYDGNLGWPGAHRSDIKAADYNQDGWMDILYSGSTGDGGRLVAMYMNNHEGGFVFQEPYLPAMAAVGIASADFNGDGYPDVVMSGTVGSSSDQLTTLALNDGEGNFTVDEGLVLPPLYFSSLSQGDADHDSDIDILISGQSNPEEQYQIYILTNNGLLGTGQKPGVPSTLAEEINGNNVLLTWETPIDPDSNGLLYDLKLGTYEYGDDIIQAASDDTGFVKIPSLVTSGPNPSFLVKRLPPGIYYWVVQAVDATLLGSGWSEMGSFEITTELPLAAPEGLNYKLDGYSVILDWATDPVASIDYYTIYAGTSPETMDSVGFVPVVGVPNKTNPDEPLFPTPNPEFIYSPVSPGFTYFFAISATNTDGLKSEISSSISVFISPFLSKRILEINGNSGKMAVGDLNNDGKMDLVVSPNDYESSLAVYIQQEDSTFHQVYDDFHSSANVALADLNRDGLLDIISIGDGIYAFINTGDSQDPFYPELLCPIGYNGSTPVIKPADFDNDGDLDFFILSSMISLVGINISEGSYISFDIAPLPFQTVEYGSVDFADSDRDGDLDMLVSGYFTESGGELPKLSKTLNINQTLLFLNDRIENSWILSPAEFNGLSKGGAVWGDYNNDGYPDVLLNGTGGNATRVLALYQNLNGEGFEEVDIPSGGLAKGNIKWADLNKDGRLDYTYFGCSLEDTYRGLRVAIQDESGNFKLIDSTQFDEMNYGDLTTADMDGDGDQDILVFANFYTNSGGGTLEPKSQSNPNRETLQTNQPEGYFLVIYENEWLAENTSPSTPANLSVNSSYTETFLSWDPSIDSETSSEGITYQILLATEGEGINYHFNSEIDFETGWNKVTRFGLNNTTWKFDNLPDGDYLAMVQAVDPGFMTSALSEPFFFTVNSALPVELESFTGMATSGKVHLKWETVTETNNAGFEIQKLNRSEDPELASGADDRSQKKGWETIGFVTGKGTTTEKQSYTFSYPSPVTRHLSPAFYRLRQIDLNGKESFSKVIEVQQEKPNEFSLSQNYPNPFNPHTTIPYSVAVTGKVKIVLFDILGRQVKTLLNEIKETGYYDLQVTTTGLASGVYYYKMEAGSFNAIKKMTILK